MRTRGLWTAAAAVLLAACNQAPRPVTLHPADTVPARLSDWQVIHADGERLTLNSGVLPYDLTVPLFSDYALKLRTVWMPDGMSATYRDRSNIELGFPVGTILSKTFHYRYADSGFQKLDAEATLEKDGSLNLETHYLVETRLLVHHEEGWKAYPYVWNEAQTEAFLEIAGTEFEFTFGDEAFTYIVPDMNQCAGCHVPDFSTKALRPIGPRAHLLNRTFDYVDGTRHQLLYWQQSGRLAGFTEPPPMNLTWAESRALATPAEMAEPSLDHLVRTYLDVNCAHCHNPQGPADTSALNLSLGPVPPRELGLCKPPVAVGRGSGNRPYDIFPGKPGQSILLYRMEDNDPAVMMPELGRAMRHDEALALIESWIANMEGDC